MLSNQSHHLIILTLISALQSVPKVRIYCLYLLIDAFIFEMLIVDILVEVILMESAVRLVIEEMKG